MASEVQSVDKLMKSLFDLEAYAVKALLNQVGSKTSSIVSRSSPIAAAKLSNPTGPPSKRSITAVIIFYLSNPNPHHLHLTLKRFVSQCLPK